MKRKRKIEKKMGVIWLSRHELSASQIADLAKEFGEKAGNVVVETRNVVWKASTNSTADIKANKEIWLKLFAEELDGTKKVITGVFPPVALEALAGIRYEAYPDSHIMGELAYPIMTPVSAQSVREREDGTKQIAFRHLRWVAL